MILSCKCQREIQPCCQKCPKLQVKSIHRFRLKPLYFWQLQRCHSGVDDALVFSAAAAASAALPTDLSFLWMVTSWARHHSCKPARTSEEAWDPFFFSKEGCRNPSLKAQIPFKQVDRLFRLGSHLPWPVQMSAWEGRNHCFRRV